MGTFEIFDHTADVGLEVRGETLEDLLASAARAIVSVMLVDLPETAEEWTDVRVESPAGAEDRGDLLVAWLQELLFHFETRRRVPLDFDFHECGTSALRVTVGWGRFDPARHRTGLEIKAVTYHQLTVRQEADGTWRARFICDV